MRRFNFSEILLTVVVLIYVGLFTYDSLTRVRSFSPDSMNYVDVARNIAEGRGLVQSTMGFNDPRFLGDHQMPSAFVSQPPLYPFLIVVLGRVGFSLENAALLIPVLSLLAVLVLGYGLTRKLYGKDAALLAVVLLMLYVPLQTTSRSAWSDTLGCAEIMMAFIFLVSARSGLAGFVAGCAFATRYALLPLFFVGLLYVAFKNRKALFFYLFGFIVVAGPVLLHNYAATGHFLPAQNPSDRSFSEVLNSAAYLLLGVGRERYFILLTLLASAWFFRNQWRPALKNLFVENDRFLLPVWILIYLVFIVWQRVHVHFDELSPRLILPAGVPLVMLWTAWLARGIGRYSAFALLLVFYPLREEWALARRPPAMTKPEYIQTSDRLSWVEKNTTERDLVIGDDAVDIPFFIGRKAAVSFSPYPYSQYATYEALMRFLGKQRGRYDHFYLVLRNRCGKVEDWGPFVSGIMHDKMDSFPGVKLKEELSNGHVFEISISAE